MRLRFSSTGQARERAVGQVPCELARIMWNAACPIMCHHKSRLWLSPMRLRLSLLRSPSLSEGSLYVKSNPSGAKIILDGKNLGVTTPSKIDNVLIGSHKVTILLDNHKPEIIDINIKQNETATADVKLSNMALMTIKSSPSGAELYIDGKYKGTTPYSEEMASGDYDVKLLKSQCKTLTRRVHLDSANPEQTFSMARQYQQPNQFYLQPSFQAGSNMGAGVAVGFFVSNINVELDAIYGLDSETIYWNDNSGSLYPVEDKLTPLTLGAKLGWGVVLGTRMRVTPQVGASLVRISGSEASSYAVKGTVGVRADYVLTNHVGVAVSPEYGLALSKSSVFDMLSAVSSKVKSWGSGFNCTVGSHFYF